MSFIPVIKAVFSASLLQSSVSHDLRNHYNMKIAAQETFLVIINIKIVVLLHVFVESILFRIL